MAKALTLDEAKNKIYDLTKRLFELERDKKAEMKDFGAEINELDKEIKATLEKKESKAIGEPEAKAIVFDNTKKIINIKKEKKTVADHYKDEIGDVTKEIFAIFGEQDGNNTDNTNP